MGDIYIIISILISFNPLLLFQSQRLGNSFKEVLNKYGDDEVSLKEMAVQLMTDTTRDDRSLLPCIYSPEVEYELSSIFIAYARELVKPINYLPIKFCPCLIDFLKVFF